MSAIMYGSFRINALNSLNLQMIFIFLFWITVQILLTRRDLTRFFKFLQTDHTEELEELCHAPNHINESGGESGGEYWLSHAHAQNGLSHPVSAQDQDTNKLGADREPSEETTNHAVIVDNIVVI